ncbi:MAG TPA: hypothetical protein VI636_21490 [Candidatus Angelobacter sp.]
MNGVKTQEKMIPMTERKIKIPFPTPQSPMMDGSEVQVKEATERWSEITLDDGTVLRVKPNILSAVRMEGQHDADGNPIYAIKGAQSAMIVSAPQHLRRGSKDGKVN